MSYCAKNVTGKKAIGYEYARVKNQQIRQRELEGFSKLWGEDQHNETRMCGRYTLTDLQAALIDRGLQAGVLPQAFTPQYNIAPSQLVPVVLNTVPDRLTMARWGLIPHWAKDPAIGYRMINARAETVAQKPAFRRPFQRQRCLVLADGFYEWQRLGTHKVPYRMTLKTGKPFAFAGLWDTWDDPSPHAPLTTCTIITTTPNQLLKPIHDRMPVILKRTDETTWLRNGLSEDETLALLKPYSAAQMLAREVSPLVNSPRNNGPEVLRPVGRPVLVRRRPN